MIMQIILEGRRLTQLSAITELMQGLHTANAQRLLSEIQLQTLRFWLLRYALRLRPDERLDFSVKDEPVAVAIGKGADGRPFIFDGENYWPSPDAQDEEF
jgi:hypothetical protein